MEMINGEKKLHVWLYKYEQDGVSPVFEVDGSRQEVEYTINNSVDSLYTFANWNLQMTLLKNVKWQIYIHWRCREMRKIRR